MKKLIYIFAGLWMLLLSGCIQDDTTGGADNTHGTLHLKMDIKELTSSSTTRSGIPAEEGEDELGSLYLLFFEPDVNQNGRFVDYVKIADVTSMEADINLSAESAITATNAYNVLAVANIADHQYISDGQGGTMTVEDWMAARTGKYQKQVMLEASAIVEEADDNSNAIAPNQLLMSVAADKPAGQTELNLLLVRNVVRFDVYNTQKQTYDLVSASIWNAYPSTPIWGGGATDFSEKTARMQRFYQLGNSANSTGEVGLDGVGELVDDIVGGLYTFENQVSAPEQNDKLTTCIIVGLKERASGTTTYYRANMHTAGNPQVLVRNNVYRLTITGVDGPGFENEELAYNGRGNNLKYMVNLWNMDDNGLITQDENSIISLPAKTIVFDRPGGESDYSIFINSKLENPGSLTMVSQTYEPADGGIVASIDGNILHVETDPLPPTQEERRGIVILSYAGLQTSINIVQSGEAATFLKVIPPDGGILPFPAFANASSGLITVEASGPWSAKIYMDGFSFTEGRSVTEIKSTDVAYVTDNKFRIFSSSTNQDGSIRQAFVVVTLDSDPDNYSGLVRVSQRPAGIIKTDPEERPRAIVWDINGVVEEPLNTTTAWQNIIDLLPALTEGSDGEEYVPEWKAEIVQWGMYDDRSMFRISTATYDPTPGGLNRVMVDAVGENLLGRNATAILRVSLMSDPATFIEFTLTQKSFKWRAPADQRVSGKGGTTEELNIIIPPEVAGLHYTVKIESFAPRENYPEHFAYLIDGDDSSETPYSSLQSNDISVGFKVGFPSLPMSMVDVVSSVELAVTMVETGDTQYFTVTQDKAPRRDVNLFDAGYFGHANFGSGTNTTWTATWNAPYQEDLMYTLTPEEEAGLNNFGASGVIPATIRLSTFHENNAANFATDWSILKKDVTWINFVNPAVVESQFMNQPFYDWMQSDAEGLMMIATEYGDDNAAFEPDKLPGMLGYYGGGDITDYDFAINPVTDNPVINFLLDGPFGKVKNRNILFTSSGTIDYITMESIADHPHAVSVFQAVGSDADSRFGINGKLFSGLVIDPSQNLILKCDAEMFDNGYEKDDKYSEDQKGGGYGTGTDKDIFRKNFLAFCVLTAQYGSLFTNQFWDAPTNVSVVPGPQP